MFKECAGVEDQVDTLWVVQLSGYSESLPAGSEKITLFQYNDFDINQIRALFACFYHRRPRCGIAWSFFIFFYIYITLLDARC